MEKNNRHNLTNAYLEIIAGVTCEGNINGGKKEDYDVLMAVVESIEKEAYDKGYTECMEDIEKVMETPFQKASRDQMRKAMDAIRATIIYKKTHKLEDSKSEKTSAN